MLSPAQMLLFQELKIPSLVIENSSVKRIKFRNIWTGDCAAWFKIHWQNKLFESVSKSVEERWERLLQTFGELTSFQNVKRMQYFLMYLPDSLIIYTLRRRNTSCAVFGLSKSGCRTSSSSSTDRTLISSCIFVITWKESVLPSLLWIAMKVLTQGVCPFGYCSIYNLLAPYNQYISRI